MNKNILNEFKQYHSLLILGFIGGVIAWIFSFTFESLQNQQNQITSFWALFGSSLFVALVWYFIISIPLFLILKLFGLKFGG